MIPPSHLRSMREEIEKRAINLAQVGKFVARNPKWVGAGLGAAGGAGASLVRDRARAPEERQGLLGALRGAGAGAVLGAGAGALGRGVADTRLLQLAAGQKATAGSVVKGTAQRMGRGVKDFAKRQAHGFTGKFESSMTDPLKRQARIMDLREVAQRGLSPQSTSVPLGWSRGGQEALQEMARRQKGMKAGITSIPGIAKGLAKDPRATAKAMWSDSTGGGGALGTAFAVGLPAAMAVPDLAKGDESAQGGRTMKQKLVRHGMGIGTGIATGGLPVIPQMVAGGLADRVTARFTGERKVRRDLARPAAALGRGASDRVYDAEQVPS